MNIFRNHRNNTSLTLSLLIVLLLFNCSHTIIKHKSPVEKWQDLKFGMFIHWGIYSIPAGIWQGKKIPRLGEQIMRHAKIFQEDYREVAKHFKPVNYDPEALVKLAKNAGVKYIVITSKHHDGFSMFDTKYSDFDIVDATPYGKDILKELAEACQKEDMKLGFYYSIPDWSFPKAFERNIPTAYSVFEKVSPAHEEYMLNQLEELLTNYGSLVEIFFDMGTPTLEQSQRFAQTVKRLQPDCLINGRVMNNQGDFLTMPDNNMPSHVIEKAWETPGTLYDSPNKEWKHWNNTWGYKSFVKGPPINAQIKKQIRKLVEIVSKGGNFLLNIGPKADGTVVEYEAEILKGVGNWLKVNGESIYDAKPDPFVKLDWGYATQKGNKLYLHVFNWTENGLLIVPGLKSVVKKAYLLSDENQTQLNFNIRGNDNAIDLSNVEPDVNLSVVVVEYQGSLEIIRPLIEPNDNGLIQLTNQNALHHDVADGMTYKSLRKNVWLSWEFSVKKSGVYKVQIISIGDDLNNFDLLLNTEPVNTRQVVYLSENIRYTFSIKPRDLQNRNCAGIEKVTLIPGEEIAI